MNLPIWSAYILAPVLVVAFAWDALWQSKSPVVIGACLVGAGLVCAAVLHAYSHLTSKK